MLLVSLAVVYSQLNVLAYRLAAMQDNYVWILQESHSGKVAVVDPSEAEPVARALEQR